MTTRLLLTSLGLAATTLIARAETAPAHHPSPLFAVLDTNHDGILSAGEIAAAPLTLAALDLNGDGVISADEWRATSTFAGHAGRAHGIASTNLFVALDANHDGELQPMEIANAASSLLRLDRNEDGAITRDELRPVMVARK